MTQSSSRTDGNPLEDSARDTADVQFGDPTYGLTRHIEGMTFSDAVTATKAALETEGFGVLTEIDVKATMKKKLDVDYPHYLILGACHPPSAHMALSSERAIGLLLPCNVVVTEDAAGQAIVSMVNPREMFKAVGRSEMEPVVSDVEARLQRALATIG